MSILGKAVNRTRQVLSGSPFRTVAGGIASGALAARSALRIVPTRVDTGTPFAEAEFRNWLTTLTSGTVVELGTLRVAGAPTTVRRDWVPGGVRYVGSDFQEGLDVDVVADAEQLSHTFAPGSVDAVIACSVFEHIRKPWLAAAEIGKVLRPGGWTFIQTHNCYPIHAYPYDYWRFTREAMESLFSAEAGFTAQSSWYQFPAVIMSERVPETASCEAFLNVAIVAQRAS